MAENLTARDLMGASFLQLPADAPLREALALLLGPGAAPKGAQTLVVTAPDGSLRGLLTPRSLLRALVGSLPPDEAAGDDAAFERAMLRALAARLGAPVGELAFRDVPRAAPTDRLLHLMELIGDRRLESVPVTEGGRVVGLVTLADVFSAAASLALAPETRT